jgi:hypothetical protein
MHFDFEKVFEDEFASIEIDPGQGFMVVIWHQHPDSDTFRRCFSLAASFTLSRKCRFWLSDARAVHYLEFADQNWILHEMVPLLGNSSLCKFARINSEESFSLLDVGRILDNLDASPYIQIAVEVALFIDRQQALNWLFPGADQEEEAFFQKWAKSAPLALS